MFDFKKLTHEDYNDIIDISKDIWEGGDYLPEVFHKWVDDKGLFLGIVDTEKNKIVSVGKFSVLSDGSGWLEGLRVHSSYRGLKLGRMLSEKLIEITKEALAEGRINKIAFSSHVSNKESVTLMGKLGFKLAQSQVLVTKELEALDDALDSSKFTIEKWNISYEEFSNLTLLKRRDNLLPLAFVFQEPTVELYETLINENSFVIINSYKGIIKRKGEINFIVADECIDAINVFMDYYLLELKNSKISNESTPFTYVLENDVALIEKLKKNNYTSWNEWKSDYLYFVCNI